MLAGTLTGCALFLRWTPLFDRLPVAYRRGGWWGWGWGGGGGVRPQDCQSGTQSNVGRYLCLRATRARAWLLTCKRQAQILTIRADTVFSQVSASRRAGGLRWWAGVFDLLWINKLSGFFKSLVSCFDDIAQDSGSTVFLNSLEQCYSWLSNITNTHTHTHACTHTNKHQIRDWGLLMCDSSDCLIADVNGLMA